MTKIITIFNNHNYKFSCESFFNSALYRLFEIFFKSNSKFYAFYCILNILIKYASRLTEIPSSIHNNLIEHSFTLLDDRIPIGDCCLLVYRCIHRLMTDIHILTSGRVPEYLIVAPASMISLNNNIKIDKYAYFHMKTSAV